MTIASEISRLQTAKASIKAAIESKWVTVPSSATLDSYATYINAITCACPFWETITVSWTEASDPTQFNPVWSDWAADAVAWDPRFDDWFWYSWVKLSSSGSETATASQSKWVMDLSQLWTLSSWDNVMIKFPIRWIKMSKSWSTVTLSMTKELNKSWFQYYAFNRNWSQQSQFYLWAYKWCRVSWVLKSRTWRTNASSWNGDWCNYMWLMTSWSNVWARPAAQANWSNWQEITWFARNYVNAMYMMKYWHWDWQTRIWRWYTNWSQTWWTTGWSWTQSWNTDATWWWTNIQQMRLFWLEDRWWAVYERLDWAYYWSSTNLRVSTSNNLTNTSWNSSVFDIDVPVNSVSWSYLKSISWTNEWMFAALDRNWSNSTYYCDCFNVDSGTGLHAGGSWGSGDLAGPFRVSYVSVTTASSYYGARLMFL